MRACWLLLLLTLTAVAQERPATIANDASCDIGNLPAATLLIPYFEVDVEAPANTARTTIFTVTNVTREAQIAKITLWTDLDYPILTFPLFLTGYDTTSINLYDVLAGRRPADRPSENE